MTVEVTDWIMNKLRDNLFDPTGQSARAWIVPVGAKKITRIFPKIGVFADDFSTESSYIGSIENSNYFVDKCTKTVGITVRLPPMTKALNFFKVSSRGTLTETGLVDNTKNWVTNIHATKTLYFYLKSKSYTITSNTDDTLVVTGDPISDGIVSGDYYAIHTTIASSNGLLKNLITDEIEKILNANIYGETGIDTDNLINITYIDSIRCSNEDLIDVKPSGLKENQPQMYMSTVYCDIMYEKYKDNK